MNILWTSAQFSMTFSLSLPFPYAPVLHPIYLINWSEILAADSFPGGSVGIYLLWIRNWDPETRTISIYSGTEEMWPKELFKGCILTVVQKKTMKSHSLPSKERGAERDCREKSTVWFLVPGGVVTTFSQIFQPSSNTFSISKLSKVAWDGFYNS